MGEVIVFLGPSLERAAAEAVLAATYLPPVSLGDLCAVVGRRPDAIVIIDGYFEQVPTVWHKEVLYAISEGIPVYGGGSMGAIRASELAAFGMIGVGQIFERFLSGRYTDDDEVAILHAPFADGSRALSDAMANLRSGLEEAGQQGILDDRWQRELIAAGKALHYPDRSWGALYAHGRAVGMPAADLAALEAWVEDHHPDQKRDDARAVLERVASDQQQGFVVEEPSFSFEATYYWDKLRAIVDAELAELRAEELTGSSTAELRQAAGAERDALLYLLADQEARRLGLIGPEPSIGASIGDLDEFQELAGARLESQVAALIDRNLVALACYTLPALGRRRSGSPSPVDG